jgi:hypothetical protein
MRHRGPQTAGEGVMTTKVVTVVTLVVFLAFNCSCYSVRMEPAGDLAGSENRGGKVLAVFTKGGETIEFDEQYPGWVRGDRIEGYVMQPVDIALAKSQVSRTLRTAGGRTASVWTKGGGTYSVLHVTADTADSLCFVATERVPVAVPLADVEGVSIRRANTAGTIAAVVLVSVAVLGVAMVATAHEMRHAFWGD